MAPVAPAVPVAAAAVAAAGAQEPSSLLTKVVQGLVLLGHQAPAGLEEGPTPATVLLAQNSGAVARTPPSGLCQLGHEACGLGGPPVTLAPCADRGRLTVLPAQQAASGAQQAASEAQQAAPGSAAQEALLTGVLDRQEQRTGA